MYIYIYIYIYSEAYFFSCFSAAGKSDFTASFKQQTDRKNEPRFVSWGQPQLFRHGEARVKLLAANDADKEQDCPKPL